MVASVVGIAACGAGSSGRSEEAFCSEYASVECSKVATFCSFSAASCEPVRVDACRAFAQRSKSGGRQYNPANTEACLAELRRGYATLPILATSLKAIDTACSRVFEGMAQMGQTCTVDFDCRNGLICDKGRCGVEHVVGAGAGCANIGERCGMGEYCTNASGIYVCARRLDPGATCGPTLPCVETFRCRDICLPRLDVGMPCTADDDCISNYCNPYVLPGTPRACGPGLTFSYQAPSCVAYMSLVGDAGAARGTTEDDAGTSD